MASLEQEDDGASFTAWAYAAQRRLMRSTFLLTGDLHRAEDLVQEALVKVADRWVRVRDANPDAYVRTIIFRDNVSWWRRGPVLVANVPDRPAEHDDDSTERRLVVQAALGRLTPKQRAVLVLRFYDDLSTQETAHILGVSTGTVKSQTSAALGRLRTQAPQLRGLLSTDGGS